MDSVQVKKDKPTVLYVDDEQQNLVSFRAGFRKVYKVLIANSGDEALEILKEEHNNISVVISDQRMPKMTGVELFEEVRKLYPDIMRIVLTGYSDVQDIINAISKGEVYRYITKPWNRDELMVTIDNAIEAFNLKVENRRLFSSLQEANEHLEEKVKSRTKALQVQNEELIELDGEKNHLIGIVAHDLKSPLSQIGGLIELMKFDMDTFSSEQKEYITMIQQSINKQEELITQILDLNALDSKASNLNIVPRDISKAVKDSVERFELTAKKKNITFDLDVKEKLFAAVDETYFGQILQNLISNAIKFSNNDTNVKVFLVEGEKTLQVHVKDNGPGLNENDKKKLFGRFQKLSARPTGGEHSTGLGLSIVKKMVEDMNGKVWCESVEGEGADFVIEFNKVEA
ncbi:hybrid sensor histidine kinase/response regulator [Flammeovirga kamogawensis]|uniref:histidine kinase n=1 Tax=Flammeovirga kamogawensis TaxID=373891 RepID=A0ABX8GY27_9BACT|nr:hybrid sensor histidine kinase/response regulator [Flammeovirga kamogawensis]MBB6460892.1 signal transduction histidine kinase [Flammeovirga kamogawensis]QWG08237.1 hybrid sensor histidine kinase/response regulator [Flammeovirga kamogawensis]TRX70040.1 hybrid sensor histidine kinase/response regulator [Flammeovirga kamogawensis]